MGLAILLLLPFPAIPRQEEMSRVWGLCETWCKGNKDKPHQWQSPSASPDASSNFFGAFLTQKPHCLKVVKAQKTSLH